MCHCGSRETPESLRGYDVRGVGMHDTLCFWKPSEDAGVDEAFRVGEAVDAGFGDRYGVADGVSGNVVEAPD